jgi:hypothetical protein
MQHIIVGVERFAREVSPRKRDLFQKIGRGSVRVHDPETGSFGPVHAAHEE